MQTVQNVKHPKKYFFWLSMLSPQGHTLLCILFPAVVIVYSKLVNRHSWAKLLQCFW